MVYNSFKCPNCGSNLIINRTRKTGKCEYCGHEVIFELQEDELSRLIESANVHVRLNDRPTLKKDCTQLYEKYPGKPITYYYLAKSDLLEIATIIDNKEQKFIGRTNYLLSCVYQNLLRLKEFNKDNDVNPQDIISDYNSYVEANNADLRKLIRNIRKRNTFNAIWLAILGVVITLLIASSLFFLGLLLIIIGLTNKWPQKIKRKFKRVPAHSMNKIFEN